MATLAERILEAIRHGPLDDDVLTRRLGVSQRQQVNQVARQLAAQGSLRRFIGPDGKLVNALVDSQPPPAPPLRPQERAALVVPEDDVKRHVDEYLRQEGYTVVVAWGQTRGVDIDARHPDGRRLMIEAKGGVGQAGAQQVNYFLGALGELIQRMADPHAEYGLALPDNPQYRGLVNRLPPLVWERLGLVVFWVNQDDSNTQVIVERRGATAHSPTGEPGS
ncbi:MarR family transcriptional regulator [Frankia sp. CNm7]|uniref:Restriction endonuclease type IV Mrr domain-containing protein n=1 Tax=Frankia nepalensis TaxID=1836974 RepID=A0A937RU75_9ACTN|nr:restriction endonuclease [Frankia nepalensis]MBL7500961.1 MarR family transcriptional regulator [Frankia nepalensis]MBL7512413.1 MarR family transcriptional regulator [Frankia nepalensis]MBL7516986.1 MarR family transcriptional regulator [Frankia nepalensis]MBL7631976.1 hypothetical protein [Frankia nepalensis]